MTVVGSLVVFCGAEVLLRAFQDEKFQPRPSFFVEGETTGPVAAPNLDRTFFGHDFSFPIRTDEHGYRLGERGPLVGDEELVLLVGDSYTFGWGVADQHTLASYLDLALGERGRVVNLGVPGLGTLEYAQRLEEALGLLKGHSIQAIVVLHVDNDPVDNVEEILRLNGFLSQRAAPHYLTPGPSRALNALDRIALRLRPLEYLEPTGKSSGSLRYEGVEFQARYEELDWSQEKALHSQLTPFQAELVARGVERLDKLAQGSGVRVLHLVLPALPNSTESLEQTLTLHSPQFVGQLTAEWGSQPIHNANSAGHYTAPFNQALALALEQKLAPILASQE